MGLIDFGLTIRPSPQGASLSEMHRANERLLTAATEHGLTCWVIDHLQAAAQQPIFECLRSWPSRPADALACAGERWY